jgi:hypothetical protein
MVAEGFEEDVGAIRLEAAGQIILTLTVDYQYQGQSSELRVPAGSAAAFVAGHSRGMQVQKNQIRFPLPDEFPGRYSVPGEVQVEIFPGGKRLVEFQKRFQTGRDEHLEFACHEDPFCQVADADSAEQGR